VAATGHTHSEHDIATIGEFLSVNLLKGWTDRPVSRMIGFDGFQNLALTITHQPAMLEAITDPLEY
jgi:hypothetical protein